MIEYNYQECDFALLFDGWCYMGWSNLTPDVKVIIENPYNSLSVKIDQQNLGIVIQPAELKDIEVVWKSGNESIVKVSSDGVVTAVAPGQAVVTVSLKADAKISATLTITVIEEVNINNEPVDQSAAEARG